MAIPINTVPLGQSGTGAAFRLGESQSANQLIDTNNYNSQIRERNSQLALQQAQKTAADWQQNALKIEAGQYWQPEFNQRFQEHLKKGIELRGAGVNPYNYDASDPVQRQLAEKYMLERQQIQSDMGARKLREATISDQYKALKANPDAFEPESIQEVMDYVNKPFSEANQMEVPQLRKAFNPMTEIVPKLDPIEFQTSKVVGNQKIQENKVLKEPTRRNVEALFKNANGGDRFVKKQTGLTPDEAKNIPDTFEGNKTELIKEYRGNPKMREAIAKEYGITGESPELENLLNQQAQYNFQSKQAYNSLINEYVGLAQAKAKEFIKTNPDFTMEDQAMARERLSLARQANARAAANAGGGGKADDAVLDRQAWIDEMLTGVPNSGERLKAVMQGRGYDDDLRINLDGNKINLVIPPKTTEKVSTKAGGGVTTTINTIPGKTVTIDKTAQGAKYKFNEILNELTGENIKVSKFATGEPSGKRKGDVVSSAPAKGKPTTRPRKDPLGLF